MTSRTHTLLAAAIAATLGLTGCTSMSERQQTTAKGAGIGAVAGAVISGATGGRALTGAVVGGAIGAIAGNVWSKRMEEKKAAMERATVGTGISVSKTEDNQLRVSAPSDLSFDVGSAALRPELRGVLDQFSQGLDDRMLVRIVGHTDSTGNDAINDPLSLRRAESVRDHLGSRGVPGSRMTVQGRGSREPVADNASGEGRAQNRRVEIFLSEPQA